MHAQAEDVGLNNINHPLRVAVTGRAIAFSPDETLAILGRERCLLRIDLALVLG